MACSSEVRRFFPFSFLSGYLCDEGKLVKFGKWWSGKLLSGKRRGAEVMFPVFSWRCISTKLEVCNSKIDLLTGQHEAKQGYMSTEWVKKGFDDIEGLTLHLPSEMPLTSICAVLICRRFSLRCWRTTMTESSLSVTGSTHRHQQVDAGLNQSVTNQSIHHPSWGLELLEKCLFIQQGFWP